MRYVRPKCSRPSVHDFRFLYWPSIPSRVAYLLEGVGLTAIDGHVFGLVQDFGIVTHIVRERGRFGKMLSSCQLLLRAI
jgi:hypothetical protein